MTVNTPQWTDHAASLCFVSAYAAAIGASLFPGVPLGYATTAFIAYLLLAMHRIRYFHAAIGGSFFLVGAGLIWTGATSGVHTQPFVDASQHTLPLLLLFGAATWLHHAVRVEPLFENIRDVIAQLPRARQATAIALSSHFIGGILSLAGLGLIASIPGHHAAPSRLKLTAQAAARGFTAAACWSPFFVGMAASLTAVSVRWTDVAGDGAILAAFLLALAWLWEHQRSTPILAESPKATPHRYITRLTLTLAGVVTPVIVLHEGVGLTIPVAIAISSPLAALAIASRSDTAARLSLSRSVWRHLPYVANELFVLLAANVFAVGLLAHQDFILDTLMTLPDQPVLDVFGPASLIIAGTGLAGLGIHPLVIITFVAGAMPDGLPGVPTASTALALAVIWGIGTMISPISAVNMILAQRTGVSSLRIAWQWNGVYGLTSALLASTTLTLIVWLRS
jgi:hypothetical protein